MYLLGFHHFISLTHTHNLYYCHTENDRMVAVGMNQYTSAMTTDHASFVLSVGCCG